jgi:hypothetical protein
MTEAQMTHRPLVPVRLEDLPNAISVFVGSVKVAAAWGPAADRTGEWFVAKPGVDAYRVENRASALAVLDDVRNERTLREGGVWLPGDPEPNEDRDGHVATVPPGVRCWGCGDDFPGSAYVQKLTFPGDATARRYYTCDPCLCYFDDEGDDDA